MTQIHKPFAEEVKIDRIILSRVMPGEDLFASLKKIVKDHGIERGVILSAIGSIKNVVFVNVRSHTGIPVKAEDMIEIEEAGPLNCSPWKEIFSPPRRAVSRLSTCMQSSAPLQVLSLAGIS
jgi:hypothetical protein